MDELTGTEDVECFRELVESYRLLVPRLIAQAEDARREAAGMAPKPRRCESASASGMVCELAAGHLVAHQRHGDTVVWSWS